ncbi:probable glutathione S-transferase parA [Andrographis paniculata]|uniref:probable glutathione S-transferase parA n=1 Tax=Andrographis paniculata TaxID=175694 RepID=UPI0021E8586B|nr:probable glutathione S-transferase parA [Andrographis paniculata]
MAEDDELIVLDFWSSPFGARVRIALREKGLEFESIEQDLVNKSSLLLEMNPVNKQLPVLIRNGKPICESTIIVQYVDETWTTSTPLLPDDPYQRSRARFWADYIDKKIYNVAKALWVDQEGATEQLIECFKTIELELGEKPYLGGDTFGLADINLVSFSSMFYTWEKCGNFSLSVECPKLATWITRCRERDSVAKSLPDPHKIYEFFMNFKNNASN